LDSEPVLDLEPDPLFRGTDPHPKMSWIPNTAFYIIKNPSTINKEMVKSYFLKKAAKLVR
jgi:hypothetical protein